jgi:hypothetical protein
MRVLCRNLIVLHFQLIPYSPDNQLGIIPIAITAIIATFAAKNRKV